MVKRRVAGVCDVRAAHNVIGSEAFAEGLHGFSIGYNDLTILTPERLADRELSSSMPDVTHLIRERHPSSRECIRNGDRTDDVRGARSASAASLEAGTSEVGPLLVSNRHRFAQAVIRRRRADRCFTIASPRSRRSFDSGEA